MNFCQPFSLAALFALGSGASITGAIADESTVESRPPEIEIWSKIIPAREALNQVLIIDTELLSPEDLAAAKKHATDQASQLQRMATDFSNKFILSTNLLRAFEHAANALGVEGVLKRPAALAGVVNNVASVE